MSALPRALSPSILAVTSTFLVANSALAESTVLPPEPGLSLTLVAPTGPARLDNRRGLEALRKHDPAAAIAAFELALDRSPTYDFARYNHLCARVLRSPSDPEVLSLAASDLEALVKRDLATFAPRWATDVDLEALRRSSHAAQLSDIIATLATRWREARAVGVAGLLVARKELHSEEPYAESNYLNTVTATRVGFYDPRSRRFFASAPPIVDVVAARHEPDFTQVFGADFSFCQLDFCPRFARASTWIFGVPPDKTPQVTLVRTARDEIYDSGIRIMFGDRGAWVQRPGFVGDSNGLGDGIYPFFEWVGLQSAPPLPKTSPGLEIDYRGAIGPPRTEPGFALSNGILTVPSGGTVDLGFRHRRTTRDQIFADTTTALVVSNRDTCVCNDDYQGSVFWSGVSTIDLATLKVTHHRHQEASATAARDGAGAVYLQVGDRVSRWPTLAAIAEGPGEAIDPGFVLELLPLQGLYCCGK